MKFYRQGLIRVRFSLNRSYLVVLREMTLASAFDFANNSVKSDHSRESGLR